MSAVSIRLTPSSSALRSTRGASSGSLTIRMAPKPSRRTLSSPPRRKVELIPPRSRPQALEQPPRDVQRRLRAREPAGGDRDPIIDRPERQRRPEPALRVEDRMCDDSPVAAHEPPDGD